MSQCCLLTAAAAVRSCTCRHIFTFLRAKAAMLSARLSHRNSVRLSVCMSHGWISKKRCKVGSPNLHSHLPGRLVSGTVKPFHKFEGGHPERGREMRGGRQNLRFLVYNSLYLSNGAR